VVIERARGGYGDIRAVPESHHRGTGRNPDSAPSFEQEGLPAADLGVAGA